MKNRATATPTEMTPFARLGALFAIVAVALGAFGAHALKDALEQGGHADTWRTATNYQMWHALAIALSGLFAHRRRAAVFFALGILFFSGSLYWIALGAPSWVGPITPLGGLSFMVGWICFMIGDPRQ